MALSIQTENYSRTTADTNLKRGQSQVLTSNTGLVAIKWRDKRSVHILSNFHDPKDTITVNRKNNDGTIVQFPCPVALSDYNQNMNFVDKFDQNLTSYKIDRKSKKWWHRIFFYLLDAAVVNSFVLYKELQLETMTMKDFRREIVNFLVSKAVVKQKRNSISETVTIKRSKPYVSEQIRKTESAHQPQLSTRRRCALCSTLKKQIRTQWMCSVCNVPLCLGTKKNLFSGFPQKYVYH